MPGRFGWNKDHLSFSAIRLWEDNRDGYRRKYYPEEGESISTVYTQFGKKIAEVLESRDYTQYPALKQVPFYPVSEQSVECDIDGVPVRGFLDLYNPETYSFGEVKSGIVHHKNGPPWTKVKVRQWKQLPFYSLLIKEKFGSVDPVCHLIWLETFFVEAKTSTLSSALKVKRKLDLTGRMEIFPRRITNAQRDLMRQLIITSAQEIEDDYKKYQQVHVRHGKKILGGTKRKVRP